MKRLGLVVVLLALSMALFANGAQEQGTKIQPGTRLAAPQEVTVSGTLDVTDEEITIKTADGTYSLSARGAGLNDYSALDGTQVEINGLLTDGMLADCDEDYDGHIFVAEASANGETYEFSSFAGNRTMLSNRSDRYSQGTMGSTRGSGRPGMTRGSQPSRSNDYDSVRRTGGNMMYGGSANQTPRQGQQGYGFNGAI